MITKRLILLVPAVFVALILLLALAGDYTVVAASLSVLPLGWWHFLMRNMPKLTWNWSLIATGIVCSILAVTLGHWLLKGLFNQVQASFDKIPAWRWNWRLTFGGYAVVWLLFMIAFGSGGVFQHTIWLMQYDKPWYEPRTEYYYMPSAGAEVTWIINENGGKLDATRKAVLAAGANLPGLPSHQLLADNFDVILYGNRSNVVTACLVIPRNSFQFQASQPKYFWRDIEDEGGTQLPMSALSQTVSNLNAKFPQD